jgi:hypothetical protein
VTRNDKETSSWQVDKWVLLSEWDVSFRRLVLTEEAMKAVKFCPNYKSEAHFKGVNSTVYESKQPFG